MNRFYLYNTLTCLLTSFVFALCAFVAAGGIWAIVFFVVGIAVNILVFRKANSILEQFFAVQIIAPQSAKELYVILNTLAKNARIALPIICISKSSTQPNIFSLVSKKNGNKIVISPAIVKVLKADELQAMLAYQVARIASGAAPHHAYLACMASLPSFLFHLGALFPAFGGTPSKRVPGWVVAISLPFTWFAKIICFVGNHKKHIFTVDILTLNISHNTNGFFHGLAKLNAACAKLPEHKISSFPALSILYNVMPIPAKNSISALQYNTKTRMQKMQTEIQKITQQNASQKRGESKSTPAKRRTAPPSKIKRPGITEGPSRSKPR